MIGQRKVCCHICGGEGVIRSNYSPYVRECGACDGTGLLIVAPAKGRAPFGPFVPGIDQTRWHGFGWNGVDYERKT